MPTIAIPRDPLSNIPAIASRAAASGLRFRVVVEANSADDLDQVLAIAPDAFQVWVNGEAMMQIGAFSDRANADEAAQQFTSYGLRALVQPIN
jgi:SPOR domain